MSRFNWNRHWTLIFALGVCLSTCALAPRHAVADPSFGISGDDNGQGGGSAGNIGDPDVPDGAGRTKNAKLGVLGRGNTELRSRTAGDGRSSRSAVVWRLYVAWLGTRGFWLHK